MNATDHIYTTCARTGARARGVLGAALVATMLVASFALGGCAAQPNTVNVHDLEFDPQVMTVPAGTTVTWVVHDETAHQVQTDDYQVKGKSQTDQFSGKIIGPGQSFSYKFTTPGKYTYTDQIQGYMTGTVVVK